MSDELLAPEVDEAIDPNLEPPGDGGDKSEGEQALGDAGKKALDAMKAQRNAERVKARAAETKLAELTAAAALRDKPVEEQALEAARAEARAETSKAANGRILKSELKAAAKGKLADPSDAHLYINLDDFTVSDDGEIDSDALSDAIDDLLTRKPHLGAAPLKRFEGSGDQGANRVTKPSQLTEADIANMSPADIEKARKEGRLNTLLGIT